MTRDSGLLRLRQPPLFMYMYYVLPIERGSMHLLTSTSFSTRQTGVKVRGGGGALDGMAGTALPRARCTLQPLCARRAQGGAWHYYSLVYSSASYRHTQERSGQRGRRVWSLESAYRGLLFN